MATHETALFAIIVAFELVGDAFDSFHRQVMENAARSVEAEPDCLRFDVLTPAESGGAQVLLYEIYRDRAAFEHHLRTDHYMAFDAGTRQLVAKKTVSAFAVLENAKERVAR